MHETVEKIQTERFSEDSYKTMKIKMIVTEFLKDPVRKARLEAIWGGKLAIQRLIKAWFRENKECEQNPLQFLYWARKVTPRRNTLKVGDKLEALDETNDSWYSCQVLKVTDDDYTVKRLKTEPINGENTLDEEETLPLNKLREVSHDRRSKFEEFLGQTVTSLKGVYENSKKEKSASDFLDLAYGAVKTSYERFNWWKKVDGKWEHVDEDTKCERDEKRAEKNKKRLGRVLRELAKQLISGKMVMNLLRGNIKTDDKYFAALEYTRNSIEGVKEMLYKAFVEKNKNLEKKEFYKAWCPYLIKHDLPVSESDKRFRKSKKDEPSPEPEQQNDTAEKTESSVLELSSDDLVKVKRSVMVINLSQKYKGRVRKPAVIEFYRQRCRIEGRHIPLFEAAKILGDFNKIARRLIKENTTKKSSNKDLIDSYLKCCETEKKVIPFEEVKKTLAHLLHKEHDNAADKSA